MVKRTCKHLQLMGVVPMIITTETPLITNVQYDRVDTNSTRVTLGKESQSNIHHLIKEKVVDKRIGDVVTRSAPINFIYSGNVYIKL